MSSEHILSVIVNLTVMVTETVRVNGPLVLLSVSENDPIRSIIVSECESDI